MDHNQRANLTNPQTIDEKMLWIKLYDRKPIYHRMIDKIEMRRFIEETGGGGVNTIPLLGHWKRFEDIDFSLLPDSFVLKCNHDSGSYVIVPNKEEINMVWAKYRLTGSLNRDYYHFENKQWGYKDIEPRILAEAYLEGEKLEYQIFCNNEEPVLFLVRSDLGEGTSTNGFDVCYTIDWEKVEFRVNSFPEVNLPKPHNYEKMIELARIFSKNTLHLRVDFYEMMDGRLYIGELTFYSHGGNFCNFNESGQNFLAKTLTLPL